MDKRLSKKHKMLNNVKSIASYDPISSIISFDEIESNDFLKILKNPYSDENFESFLTIVHECRHCVDIHSTLYGQRFIRMLNEYIDTIDSGMREENLKKIKRFDNAIRKFGVEKYYHMIHVENFITDSNEHWKMNMSIGSRYNSEGDINHTDPIILVNFSYGDKKIARVPLSTMSLLEVNAVASELRMHEEQISTLTSSKEVTLEFLKRRFVRFTYNSDLLEYSVAAQVTALLLNISNINLSYYISEQISRLALNLPQKLYRDIKTPKAYSEVLNMYNRREGFITNCDPTYAYLCLVVNLSESGLLIDNSFNINELLLYSGLPTFEEVNEIIISEIKDLNNIIYKSNIIVEKDERERKLLFFYNQHNPSLDLASVINNQFSFPSYQMLFLDTMFDETNPILETVDYFWNLYKIKSDFVSACF